MRESFAGTGTSAQASQPPEDQLQLSGEDQHNDANQKKKICAQSRFLTAHNRARNYAIEIKEKKILIAVH